MTQLKNLLFAGFVIIAALGIPILILFGESISDAMLTLIGIFLFMLGGSLLGSVTAAGICIWCRSSRKYGFGALVARGTFVAMIVSIATLLVPYVIELGDPIWIWPAVVGMPVGAITVIVLHFELNRSK